MIHFSIPIVLTLSLIQPSHWSDSLSRFNGLTYIQAAEDIISDGITEDERKDVEHLFIIASIIDPQLRNHSILGLISIESDLIQRNKLRAFIPTTHQLVVPSVVQSETLSIESQPAQAVEICKVLTKIRKGIQIKKDELELLSPWYYLFDTLPQTTTNQTRRTVLTENMIRATLQVELHVLGGASSWSADYVATDGTPASMNINEDLASMYNVNHANTHYKNGRWVKPD